MSSYRRAWRKARPECVHVASRQISEAAGISSSLLDQLRARRTRANLLAEACSPAFSPSFRCFALTLRFIFRDDLLASLMLRQAETMRTQIEQMKSRELVQEQAYSGR